MPLHGDPNENPNVPPFAIAEYEYRQAVQQAREELKAFLANDDDASRIAEAAGESGITDSGIYVSNDRGPQCGVRGYLRDFCAEHEIITGALLLGGFILIVCPVLGWIGYQFRRHVWGFVGFAVLMLLSGLLRKRTWPDRTVKFFRVAAVTFSVILALLFFAHWNFVRDKVGRSLIDGYSSYSEPTGGIAENGGEEIETYVYTSHWYAKAGLWAFGWGYLLACIGFPFAIHGLWKTATPARRGCAVPAGFRGNGDWGAKT